MYIVNPLPFAVCAQGDLPLSNKWKAPFAFKMPLRRVERTLKDFPLQNYHFYNYADSSSRPDLLHTTAVINPWIPVTLTRLTSIFMTLKRRAIFL